MSRRPTCDRKIAEAMSCCRELANGVSQRFLQSRMEELDHFNRHVVCFPLFSLWRTSLVLVDLRIARVPFGTKSLAGKGE